MVEANHPSRSTRNQEQRKNSLVKDICKQFDPSRLYSLSEIKKANKRIAYNLAEKHSIVTTKKIAAFLNKNLPKSIFSYKITGRQFIDHITTNLNERINGIRDKGGMKKAKKDSNPECPSPSQVTPLSIPTRAPIARIIPGSNTKVVKVGITQRYQEEKNINNNFVVFSPFEGVKVLGRLSNIYTVNPTPDSITLPTVVSENTTLDNTQVIRDVDLRKADVIVIKVIDNGRFSKNLGNAPPTGIDVFPADGADMERFFTTNAKCPIKFARTVGHNSFIPDFDLERMIRRHIYVVGITDAGKGYYVCALLSACVGKQIFIAPSVDRRVSGIYFDWTGQFANDRYGYFAALRTHTGEDPRDIIDGSSIGVQTAENLIEIFCRKYHILDLGMAPQKINSIKRYLAERIIINSSFADFQRELPGAIRSSYSSNVDHHIERINQHLEALTCRIWNEEIEPLKSPDLYHNIINSLRRGRFVIINLSTIRDREYRPGVVYRILNFLHEHLNDNFSRTQREMDFPVFVGIDEAHNFAPGTSSLTHGYYVDECNSLISRICAEDRKTGLSMVLITQRMAWMNRSVRANIGLWCVSKVNSVDEDQLKKALGSHSFVNFRYQTFNVFGDISAISHFPTKALSPNHLANLKRGS